jgi:cytidylate kinase
VIIAIDGPAGAGKSTVARAVAKSLGFAYLDTGAMYRAIGLALKHGDQDRHTGDAARAADISFDGNGGVFLDGEDVSKAIRTPEAASAASKVATLRPVREALVEKQHALLHDGGNWVAEGRDIGTVVAPDAGLKIFLTASAEQRARRRAAELNTDYETVLKDQLLRDEQDRQREHSPLVAAPDAVEVDTSDLTIDEVVEKIAGLARERQNA